MKAYVFVGEWRIAAEPAQVWALVRRIDGWREWWPSMHRVERLDGPSTAGPETWRFSFQTRLSYVVVFEAAMVTEDPMAGVEVEVIGPFAGRGSWGVRMIDGGTLVRFHCRLRPHLRWVRVISPVARPIFDWAHRVLMVEGGESLALRMGARMLEPVVSEVRRSPWDPRPLIKREM